LELTIRGTEIQVIRTFHLILLLFICSLLFSVSLASFICLEAGKMPAIPEVKELYADIDTDALQRDVDSSFINAGMAFYPAIITHASDDSSTGPRADEPSARPLARCPV
jgi:hypothetical protein